METKMSSNFTTSTAASLEETALFAIESPAAGTKLTVVLCKTD